MHQKKKRNMNSVHKNYFNRSIIDSDENALLDISDFDIIEDNCRSQQFYHLMGKSGKRKHTLNQNTDQYLTSSATDEDSGFCGSNLSVPANKMVRFDDELLLLKVLMKEVNEPMIATNNTQFNNKINATKAQNTNYSSKSKNGKYELKILSQPEEQHRARYLTEGSRGAIKDKSGLGHPVVKICGYTKGPLKIQCFIGHDKQLGQSHLFYQASKITGKNSTRCSTKRVDGTTVISMDACPENDMQVTVDCVGILKERNVDVEQKLTQYKNRSEKDDMVTVPTKKRSTRCRLVFRTQIPEKNEILQVVSSPILCTQPLGTPEISKKSLSECSVNGGIELFIIGKNFLKDAKVIWKSTDWTKVVEPDKEYLHPTHLVCIVPSYDGPNLKSHNSIDVSLVIKSGGKYSDPHKFTFINVERVNTMSLLSGAHITSASPSDQFMVSNLEKPLILTMIGSTAPVAALTDHSMDSQTFTQNSLHSNVSQMSSNGFNSMNSETLRYNSESIIIDEDTNMSSHSLIMSTNSPSLQTDSQMTQTFSLNNGLIFDTKSTQNIDNNDNSIDSKVFKTEPLMVSTNSCDANHTIVQPVAETVPQYMPLTVNTFNEIQSNAMDITNANQMTTISSIPVMNTMTCQSFSQPMPSTVVSTMTTEQSLSPLVVPTMASVSTAIEEKPNANNSGTDALKSLIAQTNPLLASSASTTVTPVTQANNISALSEMSDAELLCFINPATFDQSMT